MQRRCEALASEVAVREFNTLDLTGDLRFWRINHRNHRKLLVVDGYTAFVGGINVAGVYSSSSLSQPGPKEGLKQGWRETHVRISGNVVQAYLQLFQKNWNKAGEPEQLPVNVYRSTAALDGVLVRAVASKGGGDHEFEIYRMYENALRALSLHLAACWKLVSVFLKRTTRFSTQKPWKNLFWKTRNVRLKLPQNNDASDRGGIESMNGLLTICVIGCNKKQVNAPKN